MGFHLFGSSSSFDRDCCCKRARRNEYDEIQRQLAETQLKVTALQKLPNPNPNNYVILDSEQVGNNLVVRIKYPDCTNYEGEKILVFANTTLPQLVKQKAIDPHFSENKKYLSPIARFVPTSKGWTLALTCANMIY